MDQISPAAGARVVPAASYPAHILKTVSLAAPIIISRAGLIILFTVDSMMAGRVGSLELAGLGLGTSPLLVVMLVSLGALQATVVLASQALGRGKPREVGEILRAGLVNALVFGVLIALLAGFSERFFLATGQGADVAAVAGAVAIAFGWGLPGQLLFITANMMLEATDRPRVGMVIMLVANAVNILLDLVFVLGWGGFTSPTGAAVAMATSSIIRWGTFVAAMVVLVRGAMKDGDQHGIIADRTRWIASFRSFGGEHGRAMRRMGLPMGLGQGVESAAFSTLMFLAGLLGTAALAAHHTTMTVMALVYMNAVGLGGAASIRVGHAVGGGRSVDARRAGWSAIGLGGLVSGVCGILVAIFPAEVAGLVSEDPATIAASTVTLRIAGMLMAFDAMMGVAMGALRGLSDVWMPLILQAAAFWFVAIPAATAFVFLGHAGIAGLYYGIGAGIFASLALLLPRFAIAAGRMRSG